MKNISYKKWSLLLALGCSLCIFLIGLLTILVDPYFHYHAPIQGISCRMREERYTNPGIARNFKYDAIISGTSMTKNFKTSQFDELFQVNSVKMPIPGGQLADIKELADLSFSSDNSISLVMLSIDADRLISDYNKKNDEETPAYLYDRNPFNDGGYLLNKSIFIQDTMGNLIRTIKNVPSTSMDEYSSFSFETGADAVKKSLEEVIPAEEQKIYSKQDRNLVRSNISVNYGELVEEHPDTTFIFFFSPYSMAFWEQKVLTGDAAELLQAKQDAANILLEFENVEIYDFSSMIQWTGDLSNYSDSIHYDQQISEEILEYIAEGKNRITKENCASFYRENEKELLYYDYNSIWE